jgi:hypothetical protein
MKFELNLNKEQLAEVGKGTVKIGKAILVEGTKAVALKSANAVITQAFDREAGPISELKLDDYLKGGKKKNKPKAALFSFKKKKGEVLEAEVELDIKDDSEVVEEAKAEPTKEEKTIVVKKAK